MSKICRVIGGSEGGRSLFRRWPCPLHPRFMPWADVIADNLELKAAIAACVGATVPNRGLDARISLAVFPGLGDLPRVGPGVWRQIDGTHARALRYSALQSAAATLVPPRMLDRNTWP